MDEGELLSEFSEQPHVIIAASAAAIILIFLIMSSDIYVSSSSLINPITVLSYGLSRASTA